MKRNFFYLSTIIAVLLLIACNKKGNTIAVPLEIDLNAGFTYSFDPKDTNNLTVIFTDTTKEKKSRRWDFGDGSPDSFDSIPIHTYNFEPGTFKNVTVKFTIGNNDDKILVVPLTFEVGKHTIPAISTPIASAPVYSFIASNHFESPGTSVAFGVNVAENVKTFSWDFGDGKPISTEKNPTHIYKDSGIYTARLTVTSISGDQTSKSVLVNNGKKIYVYDGLVLNLITVSGSGIDNKTPTSYKTDGYSIQLMHDGESNYFENLQLNCVSGSLAIFNDKFTSSIPYYFKDIAGEPISFTFRRYEKEDFGPTNIVKNLTTFSTSVSKILIALGVQKTSLVETGRPGLLNNINGNSMYSFNLSLLLHKR